MTNTGPLADYTDADFRNTMLGALRLESILCAVASPLVGWFLGWQSVVLLVIGAVISGSGLWEWLRLMTAVMLQLDAAAESRSGPGEVLPDSAQEDPPKPRGMALVLVGFFLRLGLAVGLLYVSLKTLNGSVFAVAAGLGLGVFSLTVEVLRRLIG